MEPVLNRKTGKISLSEEGEAQKGPTPSPTPSWRKNRAKNKARQDLDQRVWEYTGLGRVPIAVRARVEAFAEARGWDRAAWWTKENCRTLARTCRDVRDRILVKGGVSGVAELDNVWHGLSGAWR